MLLIVLSPLFAFAAPPALLMTVSAHDFGSVAAGPVVEHLFSFRNAGEQVLIVNKVVAT